MGGRFGRSWLLALLLLAGCGGGRSATISQNQPTPQPGPQKPGIQLSIIHSTSGAPAGVQISWTRVDDPEVSGYYIYRDTATIPAGDPTSYSALKVNSGNIIAQSGSGTQTLTFDDAFNPSFGDTYYYRMTVANQTDDESDFSNEVNITIALHTIDSVTQTGGSIGDTVTIDGTHFGDTRSGDLVYFTDSTGSTGVACASTDYISWSQTEIKVKIPYGAADGPVGVNIAGTLVVSTDTIDYNEPTLTNLSPTEDYVQDQYITLTGTDFGPSPGNGGTSTHVYFGGVQEQSGDLDEASWSTTQIKVKIPPTASGVVINVKVSVAGNDSGTKTFTLLPHVDSTTPTFAHTGDSITINGTNFGSTQGAGSVRVKGYLATVNSWSNTAISIVVPDKAVDGNIVVLRNDGKQADPYAFDVQPAIASLSNSRRMVGEQLTITGGGFGTTRGTSSVKFLGGSGVDVANYISWSQSQIVVEVPVGAKTGKIQVSIGDANAGANHDSAQTAANVAVLLPPPTIDNSGQV